MECTLIAERYMGLGLGRQFWVHQATDKNTNFKRLADFYSSQFAHFSDLAAERTDRETFRIIKHSFDAVGNHIEANKYFAHEMQACRRELRKDAKEGVVGH